MFAWRIQLDRGAWRAMFHGVAESPMDSLSLLQHIFVTQELNQVILHCRRVLYQLSYQESPASLTPILSEEVCVGTTTRSGCMGTLIVSPTHMGIPLLSDVSGLQDSCRVWLSLTTTAQH